MCSLSTTDPDPGRFGPSVVESTCSPVYTGSFFVLTSPWSCLTRFTPYKQRFETNDIRDQWWILRNLSERLNRPIRINMNNRTVLIVVPEVSESFYSGIGSTFRCTWEGLVHRKYYKSSGGIDTKVKGSEVNEH